MYSNVLQLRSMFNGLIDINRYDVAMGQTVEIGPDLSEA